ncbi:DNA repair protein RecO, partial [Patescibacteria group bacterium]
MRPKNLSSEAIVLARKNYSEADRIIILYSKGNGKLSVIAKAVRKPKSKKRGGLEVFSRIKFSAVRGKNLDILTEVEVIDQFDPIRHDLKKVSVAFFLTEVVGRLTRDEEENITYYDYIISSLKKLSNTSETRKLREDFIYNSLVILGFWPRAFENIEFIK